MVTTRVFSIPVRMFSSCNDRFALRALNRPSCSQASSSLDPSFWGIHGTIERMWMFTLLTGQITDFSWPDADVISYITPDGVPVREKVISRYGQECVGHRGSDVFPYGLLANDTDGFEVQTGIRWNQGSGNTFSNREALRALDPRANSVSYIFDTFKWKHCAIDGYDFDDAWGIGTTK